jgi:hypothetical protein
MPFKQSFFHFENVSTSTLIVEETPRLNFWVYNQWNSGFSNQVLITEDGLINQKNPSNVTTIYDRRWKCPVPFSIGF